ncbi:MAG: hydroxyacid dehydrogenase [Anaerolineales bacterium]|jgi:D-3-phosphoglycerate dehydrogenase
MSDWKILLTDGLKENGQSILNTAAEVDDRTGIAADELLRVVQKYNALIVRGRTKITRQVIETAPNLEVIGRAGVGVDNIDLASAQAQGVTVVNAPVATTLAVAEHTIALMLALLRFIPRADMTMKAGQWIKKQLLGEELHGKTLGIIGIGNIGSAVALRAGALGMQVLAYDPYVKEDEIRQRGAEPTALTDLYRGADIVSLHVPLSPETRGMVDGQALAHMKRGVRLVSTARGGVIDETALLAAIESGQVAGAGLDVFAKEPPGLTALVAHPSVIATPHIGAQTEEAQARTAEDIASEVLNALRCEPLRWKIV